MKIKNPFLSLGAVGSINKAITFVRRRKTNIAEKYPIPKDAKSLAQLSWRHMYQKAVALWHALSSAEQQDWESQARSRHMTGFAWFMSQALKPNPGLYLPLQGGTMAGTINMAKNRLLQLPLPTDTQEAASKAYVDQALENLMWAKFLNDIPSGIGAYFEMAPNPTGEAKSTFTSGVLDTGDGQALFQWISDSPVTFTTIKAGVIRIHIHAQRTAGNKSIRLYAELYEYTDAAAEILIATTELCDFLTDDESCNEIHAPLAADYEIAPTSKLLVKFLANVGAAGAPVTLNLYAEGETTSSVSLPTPTSPLIDAEIAFHASIASAHHARYTDGEADARVTAGIGTHAIGASHRWTAGKLRLGAGPAANPTEIDVPPEPTTALQVSGTLRNSNDSEKSTTSAAYVKKKEVLLNDNLPFCRLQFYHRSSGTGNESYCQIYKNGIAIGIERTQNADTWAVFNEDFAGFIATDLIQIYLKTKYGTCYVKNMRFYYSEFITGWDSKALVTPLEDLADPTISMTNQDP